MKPMADMGSTLCHAVVSERFLGRPFADYRDSVSGLIGDAQNILIVDTSSTNRYY